jgi:hypothetical protein
VLLLSYNGRDTSLHLASSEVSDLAARVQTLRGALHIRLALDVCWGERLETVPRLFSKVDCGAGSEFLVVTSDRRVMPCSFHQVAIPFETADDVLAIWRSRQGLLAAPSWLPGCARVPGFGLLVPIGRAP